MADDDSWRGKVGGMTDEEVDEFLKGPHLCRLACLDEEGWPYIVPLWYQYRDGGYYLGLSRGSTSASTSGRRCRR